MWYRVTMYSPILGPESSSTVYVSALGLGAFMARFGPYVADASATVVSSIDDADYCIDAFWCKGVRYVEALVSGRDYASFVALVAHTAPQDLNIKTM